MKGSLMYVRWVCAIAIAATATAQITYADSIVLKSEHGVFVVPALINDKITLDFTLDSGAADVSIPADVFSTLRRTGTISLRDLLEPMVYRLADGSIQRQPRFRIQSLKVGNLEFRNVIGSVAPSAGSLLLGQTFLQRLQNWSIDNQRHLFIINEGRRLLPAHDPSIRAPAAQAESSEQARREASAAASADSNGSNESDYSASPPPENDNDSDYSCRAAQNLCRKGMSLCEEYREEFIRTGRKCLGVTDTASRRPD